MSVPSDVLTGIPAIILGRTAQGEIDRAGGTIGGAGSVKAGYICGIIGTVLSVIGILVNIALRV